MLNVILKKMFFFPFRSYLEVENTPMYTESMKKILMEIIIELKM